ncbi:hypothetical protein Fmac_020514 [Flemingia macrophylla]|uniref:Uncharacterized protein n=1 Tax=Flemingia macrophylla TaxID=520843 RepID=A0ABD1LU81_9FABA
MRIHIFRYRSDCLLLFRDKGLAFMHVNLGLSAFDEDPNATSESLLELVEFGKERIPRGNWKDTKIRLMAIVGLRMLDVEGRVDFGYHKFCFFLSLCVSIMVFLWIEGLFVTMSGGIWITKGIREGIVGRISPKTWAAMEVFLGSITIEDYDSMTSSLIEMGATSNVVDAKAFARDLEKRRVLDGEQDLFANNNNGPFRSATET